MLNIIRGLSMLCGMECAELVSGCMSRALVGEAECGMALALIPFLAKSHETLKELDLRY